MTDELREELDALRLENQVLHAALEDYRRPAYAFRKGLGLSLHRLRLGIGNVARRLVGPRRATRPADPGSAPEPYRVRVARPADGRPRVLHAIGNFYVGGSSQLVVDLFEHLGHRFEQTVLARSLPRRDAYVGLPLVERPELRDVGDALAVLRAARPDLLHVHYLGHHRDPDASKDWRWYHRLFQAAEQYGCPVVENVNIPVAPYVSPAVAAYVFVSDTVRGRFGRAGSRNVTIHPGSDLHAFRRRDGAVPDDCIGMVYRLEGDKLDERSIEVFIEVARRRPGTRALIVGGGRYLEPYRSQVQAAGLSDAVRFTGYVPYRELPALYETLSVFVAPVHRESFGQVGPFAMGMGLPVVGYDVGALREITADPSLLAPPGDAESLARIVVGLLNDRGRRLEIGARNRARAEALFSVEAMTARYDDLYRELLGAERCPG